MNEYMTHAMAYRNAMKSIFVVADSPYECTPPNILI